MVKLLPLAGPPTGGTKYRKPGNYQQPGKNNIRDQLRSFDKELY